MTEVSHQSDASDGLGVLGHCDGSADCQATEHIEGCYATMHRRRDIPRLPLTEENERLRRQLAGAVEALRAIVAIGEADAEREVQVFDMVDAASGALARLAVGGQ